MQWIRRNPYQCLDMQAQCNGCRKEPLMLPLWHCDDCFVDYCEECAQSAMGTMLRKAHETMQKGLVGMTFSLPNLSMLTASD